LTVCVCLTLASVPARAGIFDWASTTDGDWSDSNAWTGIVAPVSDIDNVIQFNSATGSGTYTATNDLGTVQLNQLVGGEGANVTGGLLDFTQSTGAVDPSIVQNASTTFTIDSTVNLSADTTVTGTGNTTINGTIGGLAGLNKAGTGTLTLNGNNFNSGSIAVQSGALSGSGTLLGPVTVGSGATLTGSLTINTNVAISGGFLNGTGTINGNVTATSGALVNGTTTINGDATITSATMTGNGTVTGNVRVSGGGAVVAGNNTLGSAVVSNGALLAGSGTVVGSVTVDSDGVLGGTRTMGSLTINRGGWLSPGDSPGTNTVLGNSTWNSGGRYFWEINEFTGTKGNNPGWDWVNIGGTLDLASTILDPFVLYITGSSTLYFSNQFVIASAAGGILNYNAGDIVLNTGGFSGPSYGKWSIGLSNDGQDLVLTYTVPEPGVLALLLAGVVVVALGRWPQRAGEQRT
jgi:cytoskeletal protein CcmA (bactofilin family)